MDAQSTGRPWRGRSPEERRQDRRRRLLDAGLERFGTTGARSASITGLCADAGVSPRHFYELYPDTEALLRDVYEERIEALLTATATALAAASDDPPDRLRAAIDAAVRHQLDDVRRGRVIQVEILGVSPQLEARRREVIHLFAQVIVEEHAGMVARGTVPDRDVRLTALALIGATDELLLESLVAQEPPSVEDLIDALADLYLAGLEAAPTVDPTVDPAVDPGRGA